MIACVDVSYRAEAVAACVVIRRWDEQKTVEEKLCALHSVEQYRSGEFFRRELPAILSVLQATSITPTVVVIDGYVWLDAYGRPGLGAYLHRALNGTCAVIGVAKSPFGRAEFAVPLLRGRSCNPLYITSVGIEPHLAAQNIAAMHGQHRIPTILRRVDHLCRSASLLPIHLLSSENKTRQVYSAVRHHERQRKE